VGAEGSKITSCTLPRLAAEPHKRFKWIGASIVDADHQGTAILRRAEKFVRSMFDGKPVEPPAFELPPATPFTVRVWRALAAIPPGKVLEYGEIAARIGRPGGSRAVGRACGANPLPLFIPCHRVLPKDGTLGGFSSGLPWKRLLLDREKTSGVKASTKSSSR
jgi:O-6-methylguanine DNA methyltransferase